MKESPGEKAARNDAFERLDERVQRWIWKQGWASLRDIQEEATHHLLDENRDLIIAAATAHGKTEAAFLPICSEVARLGAYDGDPERSSSSGLRVLVVSPLKALINDQFRRLEEIFECADIPVHRWHGDVSGSQKAKLLKNPSGLLLITPESLEAIFIRQGAHAKNLFAHLSYVVVDELHAFLGSERGRQLQSLLHRVEEAAGHRVPRVALSATLGDMALAADFLRPGEGKGVRILEGKGGSQEVKLQLRGYRKRPPRLSEKEIEAIEAQGTEVPLEDVVPLSSLEIARDLYKKLRGGRHIVFTNRRSQVEESSALLRSLAEKERAANEFFPHHGSLDKSLREEAEDALKDASRAAVVVATSTLELGIDVGSVESIAQIGPPPSVSSMRQRLGRSGRRGEPAVMRIYLEEAGADKKEIAKLAPQDQMRESLVQAVAMVRLLAKRWYEPPEAGALHLSTLVQQTISLVAQHGGVRTRSLYETLCAKGPFRNVAVSRFIELLREMGARDLISQMHNGELVIGGAGERMANHYEFYTAFATTEEYRLLSGERTLGTLPIERPVLPGAYLLFGGRRWRVSAVDADRKSISLEPTTGGRIPSFGGEGVKVHDQIRLEMRQVYLENSIPPFLDAEAKELLREGREAFQRFGLDLTSYLGTGRETLIFPWVGDRVMDTISLQLMQNGYEASREGLAIRVAGLGVEDVKNLVVELSDKGVASAESLSAGIPDKMSEKHHAVLGESLLDADWSSSHLDVQGAHRCLLRLARES